MTQMHTDRVGLCLMWVEGHHADACQPSPVTAASHEVTASAVRSATTSNSNSMPAGAVTPDDENEAAVPDAVAL
jgi:hypothetical protein